MVYKALYIIILLHIQCNMLCILCLPISLSSLKLTPKPMQALNTQIPPALAIQDTLQAYGTMSGCVSLLELAQTSSPLLSSPSSLYIFNISFFFLLSFQSQQHRLEPECRQQGLSKCSIQPCSALRA